MTNPEWYSGSDESGHVAATIEAVIQHMDAQTADGEDITRLEELLELEHEVNWRSFIAGLIGTIHYDLESADTALAVLEDAIASYRVFLDSFDDVLNVYCQSCYTVGSILLEQERFAAAATYFQRCLPYMHEVYDDVYVGHILSYLELCFGRSNQPEAAAVFAEAAVFSRHGDCGALESLMVAYARLGDLKRASEVLHLIEADCDEYEHLARVRDFARRHLGESSEVN